MGDLCLFDCWTFNQQQKEVTRRQETANGDDNDKGTKMTTIIDQISSGAFDKDLIEIEKAVADRLRIVRSSRTSAEYGIGDKVVFNTFCGTKYLHGHHGTVVGKKQKKVLVKLINPIGRFAKYNNETGEWESSEILVPTSIIDLV